MSLVCSVKQETINDKTTEKIEIVVQHNDKHVSVTNNSVADLCVKIWSTVPADQSCKITYENKQQQMT